MHSTRRAIAWLTIALCLALVPMNAFAVGESVHVGSAIDDQATTDSASSESQNASLEASNASTRPDSASDEEQQRDENEQLLQAEKEQRESVQAELMEELEQIESDKQTEAKKAEKQKKQTNQVKSQQADKVLEYDRSDIDAIGTQEQTGHTICCPSFSCAYGDAVIDGTVNDHSYYTCSCCTWNNWGAGGSVGRCVGSSEELLREAYDEISAGRPTVIHVAGYGSGEHWICLIGYQNAENPNGLTLDNFIALDPWDGAELTASERYSLYGDGCEHLSSR